MIINFGAFVGEANCPNPTVYPATKTFCHKLTRDLQVQSVFPGLVPGLWNHPPDRDTWCSGIPNGLQSAQLLADPKVGIIFCLKHQAQFSKSMLIPQRPENYTKSLIKTVGWVDETSGYIPHDLQFATMKVGLH